MESSIFLKRLTRDIKMIQDSDLEENGIYFALDEKDVTNIKCMIIGLENTPYAYGYYFFKVKITSEYPFEPPKVIFITNTNTRFNPNLYTCGKVCMSILNTWSGPQWTSCLNLKSILLALQTLLNQNPLENEPGFENNLIQKHQDYINIIRHENLRISIIENLSQTNLETFKEFKSIMIKKFLKNYPKILKLGKQFTQQYKDCIIFNLDIYNLSINNNFLKIVDNLKKTYHQLFNPIENIIIDQQKKNYKKKKKYIPNFKTTNFEIGYQCISENNNYLYEITLNKFDNKVWKRVK